MVIFQGKGKRNAAGSRYKRARSKRQFELGRMAALTHVGKRREKRLRLLGGNGKIRLLSIEVANVLDPKTKKYSKVKIKNAVENVANKNFVRRNILTKGTVIETESGKAKITSRPGQEGTVNAVLV